MNPNCLKVEKAINFFISHSKLAIIPAIHKVNNPKPIKIEKFNKTHLLNRIKRKIPAVTNVDEWTNAETGVGAAIAKGNQDEKGNCALLVTKVKINNNLKIILISFKIKEENTDKKDKIEIENKKNISPTRFVKKVIIPATDEE